MSVGPPYDRPLALTSRVRTMRNHFLAINCDCGARRIISLAGMSDNPRMADATLAHVALRVTCEGCHDGPDQVHLTATIHGIGPSPHGDVGLSWMLLLMQRPSNGIKHLRYFGAAARKADRVMLDDGGPGAGNTSSTDDGTRDGTTENDGTGELSPKHN